MTDDELLRASARSVIERARACVDVEDELAQFRRRVAGDSGRRRRGGRNRLIVRVAAGLVVVVGIGALLLVAAGDDDKQISTEPSPTAGNRPPGSPPPTTEDSVGGVGETLAAVEPSTVAAGASIRVTPPGPIERYCTDIATISRATSSGLMLQGQLLQSGEWIVADGTPTTVPGCLGTTTSDPLTVTVPPGLAPGDYVVCIAAGDVAEGCGALTVVSATSSPATSSPATSSPDSTEVGPTPAGALRVVPFGSRTDFVSFVVVESDIQPGEQTSTEGAIVLTYTLGLGFAPDGRTGVVETASTTSDGQLAIEVSCAVEGCTSFAPVNDLIQTSLQLTVRRTDAELTAGEHPAEFALRFDDGTVEPFDIVLFADPGPSPEFADTVANSTGEPKPVQTVIAEGSFAYHAISAFDSIWILNKTSGSVTRIDAVTGEVLATIPLGSSGGTINRLTATGDAVYVTAKPAIRINPTDNQPTRIDGTTSSAAIIADNDTVWAASYQGPIHRIDPDGTITQLDVPNERWIDLAISNGLVWAVSQNNSENRLIAFDGATGELVHDVPIALDVNGGPVRLVADEDNVVIGIDTSGFGGRTGELRIIDPTTAQVTDIVALPSRPEGIVLTPHHIWTSGAVLDRTSLTIEHTSLFGFTIARGPDGSIWGTTHLPGTGTPRFIATRTAPGDFAG